MGTTETAVAGAFQLVTSIRRMEINRRIEATTAWTEADRLRPAGFLLEALAQAAGWLGGGGRTHSEHHVPGAVRR